MIRATLADVNIIGVNIGEFSSVFCITDIFYLKVETVLVVGKSNSLSSALSKQLDKFVR